MVFTQFIVHSPKSCFFPILGCIKVIDLMFFHSFEVTTFNKLLEERNAFFQ